MADEPEVRKVDTLLELTAVAPGDKLLINDISETNLAELTKLIQMQNIKLYNAAQLSANIVENAAIKSGAVTYDKIASRTIKGTNIGEGQVGVFEIADGVVGENHLRKYAGSEAVSTTTIRASAVTTEKINNGAVTLAKMAANSVDSDQYVDGSIDYEHLNGTAGSEAVATTRIRSLAVTTEKINNGAVTENKIASGAVTADKIATGTVDAEASNLIYMQLFQLDEAIITTDPKAYFFVPSHLVGKKVKKLGIGIVSPATGITVTVALGNGTYGSVSGTTSAESAAVNYSLPGVFTKIPVKVTVSAGAIPKGLDFWFVVGK